MSGARRWRCAPWRMKSPTGAMCSSVCRQTTASASSVGEVGRKSSLTQRSRPATSAGTPLRADAGVDADRRAPRPHGASRRGTRPCRSRSRRPRLPAQVVAVDPALGAGRAMNSLEVRREALGLLVVLRVGAARRVERGVGDEAAARHRPSRSHRAGSRAPPRPSSTQQAAVRGDAVDLVERLRVEAGAQAGHACVGHARGSPASGRDDEPAAAREVLGLLPDDLVR